MEGLKFQGFIDRLYYDRDKPNSCMGIQGDACRADRNALKVCDCLSNITRLVVHINARLRVGRVSGRAILRDQEQLMDGVEFDVQASLGCAAGVGNLYLEPGPCCQIVKLDSLVK